MSMARIVLLGLLFVACERSQWKIIIATDAPLPQFGDQLLIEVIKRGGDLACDQCRRDMPAAAADWPISLGVVPPSPGAELLVRARLYRADHGIGLEPDAFIDSIVKLSPTEGTQERVLILSMRCLFIHANPRRGATCDPATRTLVSVPGAALVGSVPLPGDWGPPASTCQDPPTGMICIDGGLLVLGGPFASPLVPRSYWPMPERLVRVAPFALDAEEFTIGRYQQFKERNKDFAEEPGWRDRSDITADAYHCTLEEGADEELPLNCVSFDLAQKLCTDEGKRLPSEIEWEYAAGNLARESHFPWGEDEDVCGRAQVGVGYPGLGDGSFDCVPPQEPGLKARGPAGDRTLLGVRALGGGLFEWVTGTLVSYANPCWEPWDGPISPHCLSGAAAEMQLLRGGSWWFPPLFADVRVRNALRRGAKISSVGFRCARSVE